MSTPTHETPPSQPTSQSVPPTPPEGAPPMTPSVQPQPQAPAPQQPQAPPQQPAPPAPPPAPPQPQSQVPPQPQPQVPPQPQSQAHSAPAASRAPRQRDPRARSAVLAGFLSLFPGLGHVYLGYYRRAFLHVLVFVLTIGILDSQGFTDLHAIFGPFLGFFYLYTLIDAVRRARAYNLYLEGLESVTPPDDIGLGDFQEVRGSIYGGVAVVAIGFLLLLNTRFDVSFDWLQDWWPLLLIGFGAYLLRKGLRERQQRQGVGDGRR